MPQRNRIRFMVGFAAVLGAGAGAVGCQTGMVQTVGYPGPTAAMTVPAPAVASASPVGSAARPAATLGPVSVWQPAQRVAAETPAALPSRIARVSNPPSTGGTVLASLDVPQPIAVAGAADAPSGEPPAHPNEPRLEPQPQPFLQGEYGPSHPVVAGLPQPSAPHEFAKQPLPPYVVEPPDILLVETTPELTKGFQPIAGQHLVRPDGTISLGTYGSVYLAGLTLNEAKDAIAAQLHSPGFLDKTEIDVIKKGLVVDVLAYNSKFYYVITDGGGYGEQVYPIPVTGNETVLDALSKINGLPPVASKKCIWVARATADCDHPNILRVDWCGITQRGCVATNYQIFPNDRIYVASDKWIRLESWLSKRLNPVDRVMGSVLLGASTVNQIKGTTGAGGGVP